MPDQERAKRIVRACVDAFNRGDQPTLRGLLAGEAEIRDVLGNGMFDRIEPIRRQLIDGYGMQLENQDFVAEGNRVAARYRETGTFRAPAFGREPTGKSCKPLAMKWFAIDENRIRRRREGRDAASRAGQPGIPLEKSRR